MTDISVAINDVTSEEQKNEVYKVVSGDTLSGIAMKTNIPVDQLVEMNESLENENSMIRPDDELIITLIMTTGIQRKLRFCSNRPQDIVK